VGKANSWYHFYMSHKLLNPTPQETTTVQLGDRGRLVVPAGVRARLGLTTGDRFLLTVEADGSMRLVNLREQAQRACGLFAHLAPERRLADELIEERRREAELEDRV